MNQTQCVIITIGEEIVSGLITDTNSAWLGKRLYGLGIDVLEKVSVKDVEEDIIRAMKYAYARVPLVLMTGGLGPTKDDLTKQALMHFFECGQIFSESTYTEICQLMEKFGKQPTEAHRNQAYMPEIAQLLENGMGSAPGMLMEKNGKVLISMPGVPYEMKYIFERHVGKIIQERYELNPIFHKILMTSGEGESRLAVKISEIEDHLPKGITIAYLPGMAQVRIRISGRGTDAEVTQNLVEQIANEIESKIKPFVFGYDNEPLEKAIGKMLVDKNQTLSTAESCTGGFLAHMITSVPGSSAYFNGSVIAYSNQVKMDILAVKEKTLIKHGAVSKETVMEMAENVRKLLNTDYGLATSGIAGPDGGTDEKPVGTIWIACAGPGGIKTKKLELSKDRVLNIRYTSVTCMTLLRKFILEWELC
jgi:nicotinamide-nucleotide amidase